MTRLTIDATLRARLLNLTEALELCDEAGRVVGRVFPVSDSPRPGPLDPRVSEEELDRRSKSDEKTYTTAEVLAYLEQL